MTNETQRPTDYPAGPYSFAMTQFILRDIGECSCRDDVRFYAVEYSAIGRLAERNAARGISSRGVRQLGRENAQTGAVNFNLAMQDAEQEVGG